MSDQYDSGKAKKNQKWILIGGTIGIIAGFGIILHFTGNNDQPQQKQENKHQQALTINANSTDNISDTEILSEKTQQDIVDSRQQIDDLRSQLKALKEVESAHVNDIMMQMSTNFAKLNSTIEDIKKAPPPSLMGNDGLPPANGKNVGLPGTESEVVVDEPKINTVTIGNGNNESSSTRSGSNTQQSTQNTKNKDTFLSVAFAKSKLITSVDAPCGGTAQDNPFPILLNVTDNAQLANGMRTKIKGCFLLASTYGDVASERAYARLERMSCVDKNGQVIEVKVEGYLAGEDGKAGLRGRLVSKAGSKVALALLSGTVGGLGQAFASMATTMQNTPIGPTQIVTPSQSLGYAGATGVSQGFNQLAQYYINMAEKTFPVIEINDQRNVTAVFTKGIELPGNTNDTLSSSIKSLPINVN